MNKLIGLGAVVLSLAIVFVWIPLDVESGLIEKVRRSVTLGDAFAPTIAGALVGLGGLLCLLGNDAGQSSERVSTPRAKRNDYTPKEHFTHAAVMLMVFWVSLSFMRYAGPVAAFLLHENQTEYRLLRDTIPWKYIGFIVGGTTLIVALIARTERKISSLHVLIGILATLALIVVYDLPFDDLLLPPNGDV